MARTKSLIPCSGSPLSYVLILCLFAQIGWIQAPVRA